MKFSLIKTAMVTLLLAAVITGSFALLNNGSQRLLLVSSDIEDADLLVNAAVPGIKVVTYDPAKDDLKSILDKINPDDSSKYASIGLAVHDFGEAKFYLTGNYTVSLTSLENNAELTKFWQDMSALVAEDGSIDIFACNLARGPEGKKLIASLEEITDREINASTNETGNPGSGGDWLLESGAVNLVDLYFDSANVQSYSGLLVSTVKKLIPPDSVEEIQFGKAVAISGDTAVVGRNFSPIDDNGALYIFQKDQYGTNNWGLVRIIKISPAHDFQDFGKYVAIDGDTIVTSAITSQVVDETTREIFIYQKDVGGTDNWGLQKRLASPDDLYDPGFGDLSFAIEGGYLAVSDLQDDETADDSGAVYLFQKDIGGTDNWGLVKKIKDDFPEADALWGLVLAIENDLLVVRNYDNLGGGITGPGSVELFRKNQFGANAWGRLKRLNDAEGSNGDRYGWEASLSGEFLAVSACYEDQKGENAGAVYLYQQNRGGTHNWGFIKKFTPADLAANDLFGCSVGVSGNILVVGANQDDNAKGENAGAMYIFHKDKTGENKWGQTNRFIPSDGEEGLLFATYAALSGDIAVVGVPEDEPTGTKSGSAYLVDVSQSGTLIGNVRPTKARKAGGMWGIEGREGWYSHRQLVTLPPGEYVLIAKPLEGWKVKRASTVIVKANLKVRGRVVYALE